MAPNAFITSLWVSGGGGPLGGGGQCGHYKYSPAEDTAGPPSSFFLFLLPGHQEGKRPPLVCSPAMMHWTAIGSK